MHVDSRDRMLVASVVTLTIAASVFVVTAAISAATVTVFELRAIKERFDLDSVQVAELTKRASGVIKAEDQKTKTLVLLTDKVCEATGASAVVFTEPYCKTKLNDAAVCNGKSIDRYRVEQREPGSPQGCSETAE